MTTTTKEPLVPTLNLPELMMFTFVFPRLDSLTVHDIGFFGLVEAAVREAFVKELKGPEIDRLRAVVNFVGGRFEHSDDRFKSPEYAALYNCRIVEGSTWAEVR